MGCDLYLTVGIGDQSLRDGIEWTESEDGVGWGLLRLGGEVASRVAAEGGDDLLLEGEVLDTCLAL